MKRKISIILSIALLLLFSLSLLACNNEKTQTGISVASLPTTTRYALNTPQSEFSLEGGTFTIDYSDNTKSDPKSMSEAQVSGFNSSAAGNCTITIKYGEFQTTFNIEILAPATENAIEVSVLPQTTSYPAFVNTSDIRLKGGQISVIDSNGLVTRTVPTTDSGVSVELIDKVTSKVTLKYNNLTAQFPITITSQNSGLRVTRLPNKTIYKTIDTASTINLEGTLVTVIHDGVVKSNNINLLSNGGIVTNFNKDLGTVDVKLVGSDSTQYTAQFDVEVLSVWPTQIQITTQPTTTSYSGEITQSDLDLTNGKITATNSDGTSTILDMADVPITNFEMGKDKALIQFTYIETTCTLEVQIIHTSSSLYIYYAQLLPATSTYDFVNLPQLDQDQITLINQAYQAYILVEDRFYINQYREPVLIGIFYLRLQELLEKWVQYYSYANELDLIEQEDASEYLALCMEMYQLSEQLDDGFYALDDDDDYVDESYYYTLYKDPSGYDVFVKDIMLSMWALEQSYLLPRMYYVLMAIEFTNLFAPVYQISDPLTKIQQGQYAQFEQTINSAYEYILDACCSEYSDNSISVNESSWVLFQYALELITYWNSDSIDIIWEYYYYSNNQTPSKQHYFLSEAGLIVTPLVYFDVYDYVILAMDARRYSESAYYGYYYFKAIESENELYKSNLHSAIAVYEAGTLSVLFENISILYYAEIYAPYSYMFQDDEFLDFYVDFHKMIDKYGAVFEQTGYFPAVPRDNPTLYADFKTDFEKLYETFKTFDASTQIVFMEDLSISYYKRGEVEGYASMFFIMCTDYFEQYLSTSEFDVWIAVYDAWWSYAIGCFVGFNATVVDYFLSFMQFALQEYLYLTTYGGGTYTWQFTDYVLPEYQFFLALAKDYDRIPDTIDLPVYDLLDMIYYADLGLYYADYYQESYYITNFLVTFYAVEYYIKQFTAHADYANPKSDLYFTLNEVDFNGTIMEMYNYFKSAYDYYLGSLLDEEAFIDLFVPLAGAYATDDIAGYNETGDFYADVATLVQMYFNLTSTQQLDLMFIASEAILFFISCDYSEIIQSVDDFNIFDNLLTAYLHYILLDSIDVLDGEFLSAMYRYEQLKTPTLTADIDQTPIQSVYNDMLTLYQTLKTDLSDDILSFYSTKIPQLLEAFEYGLNTSEFNEFFDLYQQVTDFLQDLGDYEQAFDNHFGLQSLTEYLTEMYNHVQSLLEEEI